MSSDTSSRPYILSLPFELILTILSYVDIPEILALRQTCSLISSITRDSSLWMTLLHTQRIDLPISPDTSLPDDISSVETVVKNAYQISRAWLLPRKLPSFKFQPRLGEHILGMKMFLDRWLLVLYTEGVIRLQDTLFTNSSTESIDYLLAGYTQRLGLGKWTSYATYFDSESSKITLAITNGSGPRSLTKIYEIALKSNSDSKTFYSTHNPFKLIKEIYRPSIETIRAVNPTHGLIVFSKSDIVSLVNWHHTKDKSTASAIINISTGNEELEDLWNGIVEIKFMGPYLLLFKTRSVELYNYLPLVETEARKLPSLKYEFPATTFRGVSFSRVQHTTRNGPEDNFADVYCANAIAFDVILGLFHYSISIAIPASNHHNQSSAPPQLNVNLVGMFSMAAGLNMHTHTILPGNSNASARGFISAHCLGSQGKRAVWAERKRGSTVRELQVWDHLRDTKNDEGPAEMNGEVVHIVVSYDLRDDIIHCTLGESTGRIVLGCRSGDVFIVNCI